MKALEKRYLANMQKEVEEGHELYVRNYLLTMLLILGGGQRPEAIMNFKVQELLDGTPIEEEKGGSLLVKIEEHKTDKSAPAEMTVFGNSLAKILKLHAKYVLQWEDMAQEDRKVSVVFQSKNRKKLE